MRPELLCSKWGCIAVVVPSISLSSLKKFWMLKVWQRLSSLSLFVSQYTCQMYKHCGPIATDLQYLCHRSPNVHSSSTTLALIVPHIHTVGRDISGFQKIESTWLRKWQNETPWQLQLVTCKMCNQWSFQDSYCFQCFPIFQWAITQNSAMHKLVEWRLKGLRGGVQGRVLNLL